MRATQQLSVPIGYEYESQVNIICTRAAECSGGSRGPTSRFLQTKTTIFGHKYVLNAPFEALDNYNVYTSL